MSEPFIAEIIMFGGNFAPRGWAFCQGQIMSIAQNTALFSILGTTYGGNGQTTFALPDLRGRVPVGQGQGPGLSPYSLGQVAGTENVTLLTTQLPSHIHSMTQGASSGDATSGKPAGKFLAATAGATYSSTAPDVQMGAQNTAASGGNQPFSIIQPYLCINFIIAIEGIFPSRN